VGLILRLRLRWRQLLGIKDNCTTCAYVQRTSDRDLLICGMHGYHWKRYVAKTTHCKQYRARSKAPHRPTIIERIWDRIAYRLCHECNDLIPRIDRDGDWCREHGMCKMCCIAKHEEVRD